MFINWSQPHFITTHVYNYIATVYFSTGILLEFTIYIYIVAIFSFCFVAMMIVIHYRNACHVVSRQYTYETM